MKRVSMFLVLFLSLSSTFFPQTATSDFNPEIKRVAVFKNGYGFTYREGAATTKNGWTYTTRAPIGVLGTIWGYSTTPSVRVNQILASEAESEKTERIENLIEFLISNEGVRARFEIYGANDKLRIIEGTYEVISEFRNFKNAPKGNPDDPNYRNVYQSFISNISQNFTVAVKTESGVIALGLNRFTNVEILGQPKYNKPVVTKQAKLGLRTEGAKDGQSVNLGIAALERGIRWIPAYRVEVKGEPIKEAKIELEANIINELADLNDSEVYFVVGVPHFLFQDIASPLSINTAFAGVSSYFRADKDRNAYSNAISSQVASLPINGRSYSNLDLRSEAGSPTVVDDEQLTSFSAEQLFLYKTDKLSLKKDERTSLRLFSLTVPCSEIFEWTISDTADAQSRYLNNNYSNQQPVFQDIASRIWYALKLKNTTGMPWTTAPALSFREWKPLGQDMLKFTPTGGEEILRVTPATEVIGTSSLVEKTRLKERMRWSGRDYDFDLVTIEGTLKLKNIKKQPVAVSITRNLVGEVISATDNGEIIKEGLNLQAVNANSTIKWNLTVPSGEKEIRYTYKVYVRK